MMWQRWWRILRLRLRSLARRPAVERELDKELLFHFERQVEENLALGMPPEAARRAALGSLDGLTIVKEECRDMRRTQYFENLRQDLRYSLRTLLASPGFTAVIVLTLALSIGANSAIFSVVDGVLLKPLPYPQPDRIVRVFFSNASYPKFRLNPFDFRDFRARNRSFASLAAFTRRDLQLSGAGDPERIPAMVTTAGYFAVLGLEPGARPRIRACRRAAQRARGDPERPAVAPPLRRRPRDSRQSRDLRCAALHGGGRDACGRRASRQRPQSAAPGRDCGRLDSLRLRRQRAGCRPAT